MNAGSIVIFMNDGHLVFGSLRTILFFTYTQYLLFYFIFGLLATPDEDAQGIFLALNSEITPTVAQ